MTAYMQLLKKEMRQTAPMMLLFGGGLVLWIVYLFSKAGVWPGHLPFILALAPSGFIPFWALWRSFYGLRQEWNGDHMYLLLALPIPGWYVTSTKMLSTLIEMFVYVALIVSGSLILYFSVEEAVLPWELVREAQLLRMAWLVSLLTTIVLFSGMFIIQFSYVFSRLINKFRGLFAVAVGIVSSWLVIRIGAFVAPLLRWIPDVKLPNVNLVQNIDSHELELLTFFVDPAPVVAVFLGAFVLFVFGSIILERDVEL